MQNKTIKDEIQDIIKEYDEIKLINNIYEIARKQDYELFYKKINDYKNIITQKEQGKILKELNIITERWKSNTDYDIPRSDIETFIYKANNNW